MAEPARTDADLLALRVVWVALGLLLLVFLEPGTSAAWWLALGIPWLAGAAALARRTHWPKLAATLAAAGRAPGTPAGLAAWGLLLLVATHLLGAGGGLLLAAALAAAGLALAALGRAAGVRALAREGAVAAAAFAAALVAAEALLRLPPLAFALGTPQARAAWARQADDLAKQNVLGLRSRHEQVAKSAGTFRILALGDSFTWGDGVPDAADVWPGRLEARLDGPRRGRRASRVEVVNLGRPGSTTFNQAELLRRLGWQLEPDAIVVQFFVNDVLPSQPGLRAAQEGWLFGDGRLLPDRLRREALELSALRHVVESRLAALARPSRAEAFRPQYEPGVRGYEQLGEALREIGRAARARDVPALLVLFPWLEPGAWSAEDHPAAGIHGLVAARGREAGLQVLDLLPTFAAEGGDWARWWATPWDAHFGPEAHELAARAIAERMAICCLARQEDRPPGSSAPPER